MRDAEGRPYEPAISTKQYAYPLPPVLDDSDSGDADDEYSSDDEFTVLSTDNSSKHGSIVGEEDTNDSLEIIDDYFDTLLHRLNQDSRDVDLKKHEVEQECPPVIKPDLSKRIGEPLNSDVGVTVAKENTSIVVRPSTLQGESMDLHKNALVSQQQDGDEHADNLDSWSVVYYSFSDDWAEEIQGAEEDRVAREQEVMVVTKNRRDRRSTTQAYFQSECRNVQRYPQVTFCLIPTVISDQRLGAGAHQSIHYQQSR